MKHSKRLLMVVCLVVLGSMVFGRADRTFPFAEEPIGFKDPKSGEVWDEEVSTVHFDIVYAMAIAAGFSDKDAATIEVWNQLVDSVKIGPGDDAVYSNCLGKSLPAPDPTDPAVCPNGSGDGKLIWPTQKDPESCTTSRYGSYAAFFHWPHQTWAEVGQMKLWAWGETKSLNGYGAYAWGDKGAVNIFQAKCLYMRPEVIVTGIKAGSLKAFATYLHVLADSYSHLDCLKAVAEAGYPWGNHTLVPKKLPACYYDPLKPHNADAHGQEFGTGDGTPRTDAALLAVYEELVDRSTQREGKFQPLSLDTVLASMQGQPTLRSALIAFVHNWDFQNEKSGADRGEFAANRRDHAEQIAAAAKALRKETKSKVQGKN